MPEQSESRICGIVMPISGCDDHRTEQHWREVFEVLEEAATAAGLEPNAVWVDADSSVIQAKILKNLFENDIVICDASTANPNVMLELGMRLTTVKPTVVVAEEGTKLPFDAAIIQTIFYPSTLNHRSTKIFIKKLVHELKSVINSVDAGSYRPFLELFTFERAEPNSVSVTAEEAIERRLDDLSSDIGRISNTINDLFQLLLPASPSLPYMKTAFNDFTQPICNTSNFSVGQLVHHAKFGFGNILSIEGNRLDVDFKEFGKRRVIDTFVSKL